jgi:hypothetical protein
MTAGTDGLAAVGHYLGAFPEDDGRWYHEIRRGPDIEQLTDEQARAWAAPGDPGHQPATIDELTRRGLLVPLSWSDATGFARAHRMLPLLCGLGPDPDDGGRWQIGVPGQPLVGVDRLGYDLWIEAGGHPSLWAACESYAGPGDPHAVLLALLERLGTLTATGAACLDLALPDDTGRTRHDRR